MHFPLYLHFDWLLAYEQFVIVLNLDVTPADNGFLQCRYHVVATDNSLHVRSALPKINMAVALPTNIYSILVKSYPSYA